MNPAETKRPSSRALPYFLTGALIVAAASFITTGAAIMRPKLDASGHEVHEDGHPYPVYEYDAAATLRANLPAYFMALVGVGFIVRAAIIRFRAPKHLNDHTAPPNPHHKPQP
jgi:hypothetical protein